MFFYQKARAGWLLARATLDLYVTIVTNDRPTRPHWQSEARPSRTFRERYFFKKKSLFPLGIEPGTAGIFRPLKMKGSFGSHLAALLLPHLEHHLLLMPVFFTSLPTVKFRPGSRK